MKPMLPIPDPRYPVNIPPGMTTTPSMWRPAVYPNIPNQPLIPMQPPTLHPVKGFPPPIRSGIGLVNGFVMAVAPTNNTASGLSTVDAATLVSGNEDNTSVAGGRVNPAEGPLTAGSQPALVSPTFLTIAVVALLIWCFR